MHIYFPKPDIDSANRYRGIGFYTEHLISSLKKQRTRISYFDQEQAISVSHPSTIIHQPSTIIHYPFISPYFLTIPHKKRFPRVITVHDLIPLKFPKLYPPGIRGKIKWLVNRRIIQSADAIITDSLTSKNDIASFCWGIDITKVHIVPLAADPIFKPLKNPILPKNLSTYPSTNLSTFILYVGDINPSKNVPLLVKACIKLKTPLILVGKKFIATDYDHRHPENQDLVLIQNLQKKHPNLIFFLGFVSDQELVNLYNLTVLYCQPSWEEGFGLSVIEAMSCGCPTAVSQTSSLVEITKTNAFLFDPSSEESLISAIKEALDNPKKRHTISQAGLIRSKDYSWPKTAKMTLSIYQKILDNKQIC